VFQWGSKTKLFTVKSFLNPTETKRLNPASHAAFSGEDGTNDPRIFQTRLYATSEPPKSTLYAARYHKTIGEITGLEL
jgi:hypothetical protein